MRRVMCEVQQSELRRGEIGVKNRNLEILFQTAHNEQQDNNSGHDVALLLFSQ